MKDLTYTIENLLFSEYSNYLDEEGIPQCLGHVVRTESQTVVEVWAV